MFPTGLFVSVSAGLFVKVHVGVPTLVVVPSIYDCWVDTIVARLDFLVIYFFGFCATSGGELES